MKQIIKLVGKHNDMELGAYDDHLAYYEVAGWLADKDHLWKVLAWIHQNIQDGYTPRVVMKKEGMMEASQRKNKAALDKIVAGAFRNTRRTPNQEG